MSERDDELDRLLARGRLGGPARDRILEQALARARASRPRRRARLLWLAPVLAAAAAIVLWVRVPKDGFRARGGDGRPLVEATCKGGERARCPRGGTLVFRVDGAAGGGFLSAYATPVAGGEKIWYFPPAGGESPRLAAAAGPQLVPFGVELGAEQPPGEYELHFLITPSAPTRAEAAAAPALATQRLTVTP